MTELPSANLTCTTKGLENLIISLKGNLPLVIGQGEFDHEKWEEKLAELFEGNAPEAFLSPIYLSLPQLPQSGLYMLVRSIQLPIFNRRVYAISDLDPSNEVYVDGSRVEQNIKIGKHLIRERHIITLGISEEGVSFRFDYEK